MGVGNDNNSFVGSVGAQPIRTTVERMNIYTQSVVDASTGRGSDMCS